MLFSLGFRLSYPSPYDYFNELKQTFHLKEAEKELIEASLDYTLSLIHFAHSSPQDLVAYCFIAIFEGRKIKSLGLFNYLDGVVKQVPEVMEKGRWIREAIFSMDDEEEVESCNN